MISTLVTLCRTRRIPPLSESSPSSLQITPLEKTAQWPLPNVVSSALRRNPGQTLTQQPIEFARKTKGPERVPHTNSVLEKIWWS